MRQFLCKNTKRIKFIKQMIMRSRTWIGTIYKMTRFARARGSKSSNVKEPEEATPWSVMVKDIHGAKERNVEDLEDQKDIVQEDYGHVETQLFDNVPDLDEDLSEAEDGSKIVSQGSTNLDSADDNKDMNKKKKKRERNKDKCLNCKEKGHQKRDCPLLSEERRKELQDLFVMKVERKGHGTGRKKNKKSSALSNGAQVNKVQNNNNAVKAGKWSEFKDKAGQIVQEGEGTFQGFRVKKEDEKRLKKLVQELKFKKVSPEEMKFILKKERRRAEKELARSKKMVCYHCRKPGHFLSECPDVQSDNKVSETHSGHCFKCGSDEHSSRDCKSKRKGDEAFKFAVCFICNHKGHLAKACPDNPRGLYPNGGGCRFCGSVEHLKSDCHRKMEKDAKDGITLDVMKRDTGVEDVTEAVRKKVKKNAGEEKKKVVVF